jgi:hypothetical protein
MIESMSQICARRHSVACSVACSGMQHVHSREVDVETVVVTTTCTGDLV